jgi:hypothetical protein
VNLAAIRSAFSLYLKWAEAQSGGPAIGDLSRLFVANRYLFRLPPQATLGEWPLFGGWHGVSRRDVLDPLWPWKTMRGRKRLAGSFKGYSGGPYLALAEFDYLRRNFPAEITRRSATRSRRKRTVAARSRKA